MPPTLQTSSPGRDHLHGHATAHCVAGTNYAFFKMLMNAWILTVLFWLLETGYIQYQKLQLKVDCLYNVRRKCIDRRSQVQ